MDAKAPARRTTKNWQQNRQARGLIKKFIFTNNMIPWINKSKTIEQNSKGTNKRIYLKSYLNAGQAETH
jgi:hypothetical protein